MSVFELITLIFYSILIVVFFVLTYCYVCICLTHVNNIDTEFGNNIDTEFGSEDSDFELPLPLPQYEPLDPPKYTASVVIDDPPKYF